MGVFMSIHHKQLLVAIATFITMAWSGIAQAHTPYHDTRAYPNVRLEHQFIYYPKGQFYYSPSHQVWYWFDGYRWQNSYALPHDLQVNIRLGGIPISLRSESPYREHHYVESYYGRPWRARYYRPDEPRYYQDRQDHRWYSQDTWREPGHGYPRRDYGRDRYRHENAHHRW